MSCSTHLTIGVGRPTLEAPGVALVSAPFPREAARGAGAAGLEGLEEGAGVVRAADGLELELPAGVAAGHAAGREGDGARGAACGAAPGNTASA